MSDELRFFASLRLRLESECRLSCRTTERRRAHAHDPYPRLTRQFWVKKEIVEAERALFAGNFEHPSVPIGALAAVAVAALGLWVGTRDAALGRVISK
jgi:hypothetical protein